MAKLKMFPREGKIAQDIADNYNTGELSLVDDRKTVCGYVDNINDFEIVLRGTGFTYANAGLSGGKVDEIEFVSSAGIVFAEIVNVSVPAARINQLLEEEGIFFLLARVLGGDDRLIGSSSFDRLEGFGGDDVIDGRGGEDDIIGGAGDDTMTGRGGRDTFFFVPASGTDVITDFVIGDGLQSDTIHLRDVGFDIVKAGKNTRFEFNDGGSVLLLGVRFGDREQIEIDAVF